MTETDPTRGHDSIGGRDLARWQTRPGRWVVSFVRRIADAVRRRLGVAATWSLGNLAFVIFAGISIVVIAALVNGAGEVYEGVVDNDGPTTLDRPVLDAMVGVRNPTLDGAMTAFTNVGGPVGMPLLALAAIGVITWRRRRRPGRWTPLVLTLVAAAGSLVMTVVGKDLVGRARPPAALAVPPLEVSPSFPSGHTLNAAVLTTVVVYLILMGTAAVWQRIVAISAGLVFVAAMGLSRVYLGHHWLTDVIAGWALGFAWALAVVTAHRLWLTLHDNGARSHRDLSQTDGRHAEPRDRGAAPPFA